MLHVLCSQICQNLSMYGWQRDCYGIVFTVHKNIIFMFPYEICRTPVQRFRHSLTINSLVAPKHGPVLTILYKAWLRRTWELRKPRRLSCHCLSPGRCMYWGHLGHFHTAIYHLKWYKMVCMIYLACTFSQMKSINMFSVYLQFGVPRHFLWKLIAVWT